MSCWVSEEIILLERRLARMTFPAAIAAFMAAASARFCSDPFIARALILVGLELLSSFGFRHSDFNFLPFQVPGVLVEVNIVIATFEFAPLEIDSIGTHRAFRRRERLGVIAIGGHAVLVQT